MDTDSSYSSNIHQSIKVDAIKHHTQDSGYGDEMEAEYDADRVDLPEDGEEAASNNDLEMYSRNMDDRYKQHRGRLPSMDMGIDAIINRPTGYFNDGYSHHIDHSPATATGISSHIRMTDNPSDAATSTSSQSRMAAILSEPRRPISILSNGPTDSTSYSYPSSSFQLGASSASTLR